MSILPVELPGVFEPVVAYVSDRALAELPRFFSGLEQILGELFQNSYRAGADQVAVTINPAGNVVTLTDNGRGCPQPYILFGAGDTGWDEAKVKEPAGMGFFSIFNEQIIKAAAIESCNWRINVEDVSAVLQKLPLQPRACAFRPGFSLTLTLADPPKLEALSTLLQKTIPEAEIALSAAPA